MPPEARTVSEDAVFDRSGGADVHTADGVDHALETGEVHSDEVPDFQAGHLLDDLDQAFGATECVRRIEFVPARCREGFAGVLAGVVVPSLTDRTFDVEVTREGDGDDAASVGGNVHQHDRVGSGAFGVFDGSGADLTARTGAGIGADDQVRLVAELTTGVDDVVGLGVECRNLIETAFDRAQITPHDAGQCERHDGQERYCRSADHFCAMAAANLALRQTSGAGVTDYPRHCGGDGMFFGDPVRSGGRNGRTGGNRPGGGRRRRC